MASQDVSQKHGKGYWAAANGRLFHGATAATGVAPGTAIGTTAAFSLHNPLGSGVDINIRKVSMGYISGTLGAGTVWHLVNLDPSAAAPTGTAITETPGKVTGAAGYGIALTTSTLAVAPRIIRPFAILDASLATSVVGPRQIVEDVDGEIIIPPGCTYSLHSTAAAGTSPLVAFGVTWEEVGVGSE